MEFAAELLAYSFMQSALAAILLASVACGIVGTLVVCNRLTFLAGGAAHAAYGGIGLAFHFGLPVLPCTVLFTLAASLGMGAVALKREEKGKPGASTDAAIGVLWAAGMAFGIILIQLTPGYAGELTAFLFGSLLSVPVSDLWVMAAFDLLLLLVLALCGRGLFLVSADPDFARSRGIPARGLALLITGLTAVAVVLLIRVAGLILVLALLTIPPLVARRVCKTFYGTMLGAFIASLAFCLAGLSLSWILNLSPGAVIVGIATITYFGLSLPVRKCARVAALCLLVLGLSAHAAPAEAAPQQNAGSGGPQDKASAVNFAAKHILTSVKPVATPNALRGRTTGPRVGTQSDAPTKTSAPAQDTTRKTVRTVASAERTDPRTKAAANARRSVVDRRKLAADADRKQTERNTARRNDRNVASAPRASRQDITAAPRAASKLEADDISRNNRATTYDLARSPGTKADLEAKGISSGFANQRRSHKHTGVDIPAVPGSPVLAFKAGEVVFSGRYFAYGTLVRVRQTDGREAFYGHLQSAGVKEGAMIKAGQQIGTVGRTGRATGYHLHFELRENDVPLNPTPYLVHACEIVPEAKMCPTPDLQAQAALNAARRDEDPAKRRSLESFAGLQTPAAGTTGTFPTRLDWNSSPATALP